IGGNGLNTSNIFPVCQQYCNGVLIAQAYNPGHASAINQAFRSAYLAQSKGKEPPQFSAQAFTAVQVVVEALKMLDKQTPIATIPLPQLRTALNTQLLKGRYETPLGTIAFTPEGEVVQTEFYVAQIKMNPDGKSGKFEFLP
ncbi:MAG: ABC transporter substrate-binding protein, partial [Cyanobacteria bacterium]|nr:ABC transporter substrate-binding protein [Cyanobacteriota bacterium]MDW8202009.1 ABC transporter substrate-binding protein [Cyanobacteriota bacterium SKYGB_h_bin112]